MIVLCTLTFFEGNGDSGDGILHYIFARYAPKYPELYFHHWAKPIYVLLMSPFAQFGMLGVKIFNAICGGLSVFLVFRISQLLNFKEEFLSPLFLIFTPLYYILTFSGLTEPLFALVLILGVYLACIQKYTLSAFVISFLPFVRSEGLIFLCVFAIYFLLIDFKIYWKAILLLGTGHLVYSFAGFYYYHDLLWVFNKIPYAQLKGAYGSGQLFHFVNQLTYVIGIPLYILLILGMIHISFQFFQRKIQLESQMLILGGFLAFFVAHSLFWYLGIFNSMGLKRVFVGVAPLSALLAAFGWEFLMQLTSKFKQKQLKWISFALLMYVFIFPFVPNPASIQWNKDMRLGMDEIQAKAVAQYITEHLKPNRIISNHPALDWAIGFDRFDPNQAYELGNQSIENIKSGDIVIWDDWFSPVKVDQLDQNPSFQKMKEFKKNDNQVIYVLYYCK